MAERAFIGKHPHFGDFLLAGLDKRVEARIFNWLKTELPILKENLGDRWEQVWDSAPDLGFWIPAGFFGVPFTGVMKSSRDKVGRRFPMMFGVSQWVTAAPIEPEFDLTAYNAIADAITAETECTDLPSLIAGINPEGIEGEPWQGGKPKSLWGGRGDGDLGRLLSDAVAIEHYNAEFWRGHWWVLPKEGQSDVRWLAHNDLPNAAELKWLYGAADRPTERDEEHG